MNKYKAIAIDLDGTLLNDEKKISTFNKEMIHKIKEDTKVIISTARGLASIMPYLEELEILNKNNYTVAYNGRYIMSNDKEVIYDNHIDKNDVLELVNFYLDNAKELEILIFTKDRIIKVLEVENLIEFLNENYIYKVGAIGELEYVNKYRQMIPSHLNEALNINSDLISIECVNRGMSKAGGLKKVLEMLDIKEEELVAVGDAENDIEMIEMAGLGVAMGNGSEALKEKADMITLDNNHDGVGKLIEKVLL